METMELKTCQGGVCKSAGVSMDCPPTSPEPQSYCDLVEGKTCDYSFITCWKTGCTDTTTTASEMASCEGNTWQIVAAMIICEETEDTCGPFDAASLLESDLAESDKVEEIEPLVRHVSLVEPDVSEDDMDLADLLEAEEEAMASMPKNAGLVEVEEDETTPAPVYFDTTSAPVEPDVIEDDMVLATKLDEELSEDELATMIKAYNYDTLEEMLAAYGALDLKDLFSKLFPDGDIQFPCADSGDDVIVDDDCAEPKADGEGEDAEVDTSCSELHDDTSTDPCAEAPEPEVADSPDEDEALVERWEELKAQAMDVDAMETIDQIEALAEIDDHNEALVEMEENDRMYNEESDSDNEDVPEGKGDDQIMADIPLHGVQYS